MLVIDDLRVVDAEAATDDGAAVAEGVGDETHARGEGGAGVGEGLLLVTNAEVQSQLVTDVVVILREDGEEIVVDRVRRVAEALRVAGYVGDVV